MKIIVIILCFSMSLLSCEGQKNTKELVKIPDKNLDSSFSKVPYFLCDYYFEFQKLPSSKQDFQWFLKEIEGEEQVYKTLDSLSYGFKLNELEGEIFLYEFGFDNDDDKAKIRYFIDDSVSNKQDGDLVILRFSIKDCLPRIRKYKSVFQAYRDQEKISLNKEFTDSVKKEIIKSIDYLNQEGVF